MLKSTLVILSLIVSIPCFSQQGDEQYTKNKVRRASGQINRLKEGVLLVRLFYKDKAIERLEKYGKKELAEKQRKRVNAENLEIINAFNSSFSFCPVYFFNAKYTDEVKNRNFEGVSFLNSNGKEDSQISFDSKYFYSADISELRVDTTVYEGSKYLRKDENDNEITTLKTSEVWSSVPALVIRSDKFVDLRTPFPYMTRTFSDLPMFERSYKATVKRMNGKLLSYYNSLYKR